MAKVRFNGVTYNSFSALAKELNVSSQGIKYHMKKGCSVSEAVNKLKTQDKTSKHTGNSQRVIYNNKQYSSYRELTNAFHVNYDTFLSRLAAGKTIEEAMAKSNYRRKINTSKIVYRGKEYSSYHELCKEFNRHETSLLNKLKKGKTLDEAMSIRIDGKTYSTYDDIAKAFNLDIEELLNRLKQGEKLRNILNLD